MVEDSQSAVRRLFERLITAFIILLVLGLYPLTDNPTGDFKELLTAWGACLIGGGWLFCAWWYRIPARRPLAFAWPLGGLLALYALASLTGTYHTLGLLETARLAALITFYYVASQVYTTPDAVLRLVKVLVTASVAASLYGFMQASGLDPVPWDVADKASDLYTGLPASYGNPNFAAHAMVLTLPLALYLLWRERRPHWGIAAIILLIHLGMTGQRASYIAFAGAAALLFAAIVAVGRLRQRPLLAGGGAIVLWGLIGIVGVLAGMGLLTLRTGSSLPLDTSLHIRYWSYVSATDMIKDAPLLGHGPGAYRHTYHTHWTQLEKEWYVQENRKNEHVHNDLMEISIDAGLPAAGLYLLTLLLAITYSVAWAARARKGDRALGLVLAAILGGFLLDGLFGFNVRVPVSAGFLFLLLGALDGLLSGERPAPETRRWTLAYTGVSLALTAIAVLATCVFAGQYRLYLGMRALAGGQFDIARQNFDLGEGLAPWEFRFALQRSKINFLQNDLEGAITELNRMFSINPNYFPAKLTLARYELLFAQRKLAANPSAIEEPLKHLEIATAAAEALNAVCGMHPQAEMLLGRAAASTAMALTTSDKKLGVGRAKPYWEAAEKHFENGSRAALEDKDDLFRLLAQTKVALGKPDEAEAALERAAKSDPADPATWGQLLAFANGNRRYERARNTLVAVIGSLTAEATPRADVLSLVRMCLANVQENGYQDYDRAEKEYREAAALTPLSPELWSNFARFAFQRGRVDALKETLAAAEKQLKESNTEIPPQLRVVFAAMSPAPDALTTGSSVLVAQVRSYPAESKLTVEQCFEWTARLLADRVSTAPPDAEAVTRFNLGIVYAQFKKYEIAESFFAAANGHLPTELLPKHAAMWSEVLVKLSRGLEAVNLVEPLRAQYPDDLDVWQAYARALAAAGRIPEAKDAYNDLLARPELGSAGRAIVEQEANALR